MSELDCLEQEYVKYRSERSQIGNNKDKKKTSGKIVAKSGTVKKVVKKSKGLDLNFVEE
jgi:hypothetical protein